MQRVAPSQALCCQPSSPRSPVALYRLERVVGAAGLEAARHRKERREHDLVGANHGSRRVPRGAHRRLTPLTRRESSVVAASWSSRAAPRRAITTRSRSASKLSLLWRNHSRIQRFTRFRSTAPPTRRLAVMPSLGPLEAISTRAATSTTKSRDAARRPSAAKCRKSRASRRRSARRKRAIAGDTPTWRGLRRRGAFAPWFAGASAPRGHPSSSTGRETHVRGADESGSAGRYVSWRSLPDERGKVATRQASCQPGFKGQAAALVPTKSTNATW
jgi:hypothetical protein